MVCELITEVGSNYMFNNAILPHNPDFEKVTFNINQSGGLTFITVLQYKKLILETSRVINKDTRDINHYTFRLNTENSAANPIKLEVFVTHLKSGFTNRQRRLSSGEDFIASLNDIPDSHVIFAGDFNFYTSNEEGIKVDRSGKSHSNDRSH